MRRILCALALALAAGCTTFREQQVDAYVDDDGRVLVVRFGELSRSYTYEMVSPANGAVIEGRDRRVFKLELPDNLDINGSYSKSVTCRICQAIVRKGTMYMSVDQDWLFWTIGTKSRVYLFDEELNDYVCVFEGAHAEPAGQGSL